MNHLDLQPYSYVLPSKQPLRDEKNKLLVATSDLPDKPIVRSYEFSLAITQKEMIDIKWPFPTHMDFRGQKMAERLFQVIIIFFGLIGFLAGYMMQQFSMTIYSVLFGVLISAVLTIPPWPMYRNNPIEWQKPVSSNKETSANKNSTSTKSPNKDVRKPKAKKDQ